MEIDFVKLNGCGNDFIFIDDLSNDIELEPEQVRKLCDRHFGIGADGVILVRPSENPDCVAYMHYINADGSLAEMCGNGVRCFAKYLVDHGYVSASDGKFVADTKAGERPISFTTDRDGRMETATVDMGRPILDPVEVPVSLAANAQTDAGSAFVKEADIASPWISLPFTCVSMGNPHAVTFIDDFSAWSDELFTGNEKSLSTLRVDMIGAFYESNPAFPAKANIEFAQVADDGIHMRVYERGDGETLACGTGACATGVAAALTGRTGKSNDLHLLGGILHIEWADDGHVMMTGPAAQAFTGTVDMDLL
ncbi:MAG: diaminopimelate epimerase [Eggerthellaceae bacterium]|jgi:diaminopimelate epimerase